MLQSTADIGSIFLQHYSRTEIKYKQLHPLRALFWYTFSIQFAFLDVHSFRIFPGFWVSLVILATCK